MSIFYKNYERPSTLVEGQKYWLRVDRGRGKESVEEILFVGYSPSPAFVFIRYSTSDQVHRVSRDDIFSKRTIKQES